MQAACGLWREDSDAFQPGALSVSAEADSHGHRYVAVPLVWENKLALVDAGERRSDAADRDRHRAIRGGDRSQRLDGVGEQSGRTSAQAGRTVRLADAEAGEKVVVDSRGVASTGAVTRVDLETGKATHTLAVGLHPTALALDEARRRLYVANGNGDSVSVIDTERVQVVRTIAIQPFSQAVRGIAPTALQVSADGATLYAACGGINAVAVIDTGTGKIRGMIPTGWYPNGLALDPGGKYLAVSSLLGPGSGWRDAPSKRFVHANRGSVAVLPLPDAAQLASYTTAVAENNRLRLAGTAPDNAREAARNAAPVGDSGALRRAFDDRARGLHHQGESHVRPGAGRYGEGQRRPVAGDVRRGRHAQPAPPGRAVRPARQLLRHGRQQRRRASVDHAGERDGVLSVAGLPGPQLSVRRQRPDGVLLGRIPVELRAGARALGARVRRVCGAHEHCLERAARPAPQMGEGRRLHGGLEDSRADRVAERDCGGELSVLLDFDPRRGAGADLSGGSEAVRKRGQAAEPDAGADCPRITPSALRRESRHPRRWWRTTTWRWGRSWRR